MFCLHWLKLVAPIGSVEFRVIETFFLPARDRFQSFFIFALIWVHILWAEKFLIFSLLLEMVFQILPLLVALFSRTASYELVWSWVIETTRCSRLVSVVIISLVSLIFTRLLWIGYTGIMPALFNKLFLELLAGLICTYVYFSSYVHVQI